jgi:lipopolysaccharide heptosyltransferase II
MRCSRANRARSCICCGSVVAKSLVVKLGAIGDVVLALPALEVLREEHPQDHVTFLIGKASAPLLENHPALNRLWVIDENIFWQKRLFSLFRLARELRRERFDRVYILHWSSWFHRFFKILGVPERWGFNRDGHASALTRHVPYVEGSPNAHDVSQYVAAVSNRFSASPVPHKAPRLYFSENEKRVAKLLTGDRALPIAIAPGGGNNAKLFMPQKRWLPERYQELAERLIQEEQATLFVCGDASEAPLLKSLADRFPKNVQILAGKMSLRETAAVISQCRLFIGNDSGLFHVAGAVGTPVVGVFGPTSPHGKMPTWGPYQLLYSQEPCSPCYKHGQAPPCPYELQCMVHISTQSALEAAQSLLRVKSKTI